MLIGDAPRLEGGRLPAAGPAARSATHCGPPDGHPGGAFPQKPVTAAAIARMSQTTVYDTGGSATPASRRAGRLPGHSETLRRARTAPMISRTWILLTALVWGGPAGAHAQSWSARRVDSHAPLGVMGDHTHEAGGEWMLSFRAMRMVMDGNRDRHRPSPGRWRTGRLSRHTAADAHGHVHGGRHVRTHRSFWSGRPGSLLRYPDPPITRLELVRVVGSSLDGRWARAPVKRVSDPAARFDLRGWMTMTRHHHDGLDGGPTIQDGS